MQYDTRDCGWCNTPYTPKRVDQRTCSKECRTRRNWAEQNAKRLVRHESKRCATCLEIFTPKTRVALTCSPRCSMQLANKTAAAKRRAAIIGQPRACGWCEIDITNMRNNARFCCRQHKKNAASLRHRSRNPGYYKRYNHSQARVQWLHTNRARIRAYARHQQRIYRDKYPGRVQAWFVANPIKRKLYSQKRRSAKGQAIDSVGISERDWQRLVRRYRGGCAYCGDTSKPVEMDHVIPLKRGGRHAVGNILPTCRTCNSSKNARLLAEWRHDTEVSRWQLAKRYPHKTCATPRDSTITGRSVPGPRRSDGEYPVTGHAV